MWLVLLSCWALTVQGQLQEPDVSQQCTGLNRSITYTKISLSRPDAAHKCFLQGGMLARVLVENEACLKALMMSLDSGAELEQTRVSCGDCSSVADCVTTLQNTMHVTMSYSTLRAARPFLCETHDRCQYDLPKCSAAAGCPQIRPQHEDDGGRSCVCYPGYTGDGIDCTPIESKAMPCNVTTTKMAMETKSLSPSVAMTTPAAESSSSKSSNIGLYAGAGAGAVVLVLLIVIVALLLKRRRDRRGNSSAGKLHNVQRGSSGMGLLGQSETSRPTLSSPRYEQSPTETSLGAVASSTSMDDANPTPKVPLPVYTAIDKETMDTTQEPDLYNVLQRDGHAGSGGSSQDAGATNTTTPPGEIYNTLQFDTDKEAGGPSASEVYASVGRQG